MNYIHATPGLLGYSYQENVFNWKKTCRKFPERSIQIFCNLSILRTRLHKSTFVIAFPYYLSFGHEGIQGTCTLFENTKINYHFFVRVRSGDIEKGTLCMLTRLIKIIHDLLAIMIYNTNLWLYLYLIFCTTAVITEW